MCPRRNDQRSGWLGLTAVSLTDSSCFFRTFAGTKQQFRKLDLYCRNSESSGHKAGNCATDSRFTSASTVLLILISIKRMITHQLWSESGGFPKQTCAAGHSSKITIEMRNHTLFYRSDHLETGLKVVKNVSNISKKMSGICIQ